MLVESVAASIDAVLAKGGQIVQGVPPESPEVIARFADPDGNVLGLYQEPG